jgi:hypothetical protein
LPAEAVNGIVTSHLAAGDDHRTASKVFIARLSFRDATSIDHHSAKSGSNLRVVRRVNPNDALTKSRNERAGPVTSELVDFYVDMTLEKMEHIAVEHQSDMVIPTSFVRRGGRPALQRYSLHGRPISSRVGDPGMRSRSALYVCVALLDHGADRGVVQDLLTRRLSKSTESHLHPRTKCLREAVETASRRV